MNEENRVKVEIIESIIDTLSDLRAIKAIEQHLYVSRSKIAQNADRELERKRNQEAN